MVYAFVRLYPLVQHFAPTLGLVLSVTCEAYTKWIFLLSWCTTKLGVRAQRHDTHKTSCSTHVYILVIVYPKVDVVYLVT